MRTASATLALLLLGLATLCLAAPPKGDGMAVALGAPVQAGGTGALATHGRGQDCEHCHVQETLRGHPSGFVTRRELPPGLRLDPGGRFTCRTCHDAQLAGGSMPGCGQCHDAAFFDAMADGGASLRGLAHPAAHDRPEIAGGGSLATECLGCHMDHGENRDRYAGGLMYAGSRSAIRNHPVGLRYESAVGYGGYIPAAALPPEVRLFNGRLSCLSCHRSYSASHGVTVLPTAGSRLCFACHDL